MPAATPRSQDGRHLLAQRLGVMAFAEHHQDEVVAVAHESPVAEAFVPALTPLPVRAHLQAPGPVEVFVQRRQGDVGEQR